MARWHGKHPIPWDYFNSMSAASGQDLSWFFNNWFFTNNYIDLALDQVTATAQGPVLTVRNPGGFAVPVTLQVTYADGSSATVHQSPAVWRANPRQATIAMPGPKAIRSVALVSGIYMDADESNNRLTVK